MKKVFFALFAVVIAVGGSAFTNAKVDPGTIYGSTDTNYTLRTTVEYDNDDCRDNVAKTCAYQVTELGKDFVIGSSYTDLQMSNFLTAGYVTIAPGAKTGLYLPN